MWLYVQRSVRCQSLILRFHLQGHKIEQSKDSIRQGKVEEKTKAGLSSPICKMQEEREYKRNP